MTNEKKTATIRPSAEATVPLKAIMLMDHIEDQYNGNITHFANAYGLRQQQASRWINNFTALWVNGQLYLQKTKFSPSAPYEGSMLAIPLVDYIADNFSGNNTLAAKSMLKTYQSVCLAVKENKSIWLHGNLFRQSASLALVDDKNTKD
jgi:hypothetical protein